MNKQKRGVMQLPFGLIFSIILIVIFIVVAIIAVKALLNTQKCSQINIFADDLQKQIDEIWKGSKGEVVFASNLPSGIEYVCFADLSKPETIDTEIYEELRRNFNPNANLYFYPQKHACGEPYRTIYHINLTSLDNPYCIENNNQIKIRIQKDYFESLVSISRT